MFYIGTCFRFYTQMRVQKKKHLHIEFIVTSHNSVALLFIVSIENVNMGNSTSDIQKKIIVLWKHM